MNKKINYGMIFSVVLAVMLLAGAGLYVNTTSDLKNTIQDRNEVITDKDNALLVKDTEISTLANEVTTLSQKVVETIDDTTEGISGVIEEAKKIIGFLTDEYFINDTISEDLSDRELNLFDGKVEFIDSDGDDENYNLDEYLNIKDIKLKVNEDDFDENVYAVVSKEAVEYKIELEKDLNTSLITTVDSLMFSFLGELIEITKWDNTDVTFKKADEMIVNEGDTMSVNGVNVLLDMVGDDFVYITVNGESKKIAEDKTKKIGGIEVYVSDILYSSKESRVSKAVLSVGSDVEETVSSGDEYADESIWNWEITDGTIGIILNEEFKDLDDRDGFKPLGYGDSICLPNDYVCIKLNDLIEDDYSEYSFDFDYGKPETEIKGEFEVGTENVNTVLINSTGMYYEDEEGNLQNTTSVNFKNSDETLNYSTGIITISGVENLVMPMNLSYIEIDSESEVDEGKYRSIYGSVIDIKEDLDENKDEDKELSILMPENKVELNFLVY